MRVRPKRWSRSVLGLRVNGSGPRVTSVTVGLGRHFRLELWRRRR
jgi:hypothetical protein